MRVGDFFNWFFLCSLLGGCAGLPAHSNPTPVTVAVSTAGHTPTSEAAETESIPGILAHQDRYLGHDIVVVGVLESEGQLPDVRFFLRDANGARLEVSPWAPLEVMHPPDGTAAAGSMAAHVGRTWRLSGVLEKREQALRLRVTSAEEP